MIAKQGREKLSDAGRFIRAGMASSDTGPLVVSEKVVFICDHWETYKHEAGDMSFRQWLTRELGNRGRNYSFFKRRLRAVEMLGESVRRTLHHEVAVYVSEQVPEAMRARVKSELEKRCMQNNHCPLTKGQALPIIRKMLGHVARPKECQRCKELETRVAELERGGEKSIGSE